jgi:hypothetical protein
LKNYLEIVFRLFVCIPLATFTVFFSLALLGYLSQGATVPFFVAFMVTIFAPFLCFILIIAGAFAIKLMGREGNLWRYAFVGGLICRYHAVPVYVVAMGKAKHVDHFLHMRIFCWALLWSVG